MTGRTGLLTGIVSTLILVVGIGVGWWLLTAKPGETAKSATTAAPATVPVVLKEDLVNTITLTPDAIARLALKTALVERKSIHRERTFGGDVTIPIGHSVIVSAPLSGLLKAPVDGPILPGNALKRGQPIFQLLPILTPEGRANLTASKIDADGQAKSAQTQVDAAKIALERAKRVFASEAGSRRAVDEAQAAADIAQKTFEAATARLKLLERVVGDIDKGNAAPMIIESPEDGVLRTLSALPGQNVPSGAALFEVVDLTRVWVRVPIYVGEIPDLDGSAIANVSTLSAKPGSASQPAQPIDAPPSANALAGTADLFYSLDNSSTKYRPGERVSVRVRLRDPAMSLTIPWSAIVHDIHGGTWVYEQTAERVFLRRRVVVRATINGSAVLESGLKEGTRVVTAGVAELFGSETGFTK